MLNTNEECATELDMTRTRNQDRRNTVGRDSKIIGVRVTPAELSALDALVAMRQALADEQGLDDVTITPTGIMRSLLRKEAKARGVWNAEPPKQQALFVMPPATEDELPDAEPVIEAPKPSVQASRRPAVSAPERIIEAPPAPSARDLVLATVRRVADSKSGLASVPAVVQDVMNNSPWHIGEIHAALLELGEGNGPLELRPESGVTSKVRADASLCPRGAKGVVLSMVCERQHAAPEAPTVVPQVVDAEALRKRMGKASKAGITIRALAAETGIPVGTLAPFKSGKAMGDEKRMVVDAALRKHGI